MSKYFSSLTKSKAAEWTLRIASAGAFTGHGIFALQGKESWFGYFYPFGITTDETIIALLFIIGVVDIILALHVLIRPIRAGLLWMAIWGLWTAILRPIAGDPIWDFVERLANAGAPLALLFLMGWPKSLKDWFR